MIYPGSGYEFDFSAWNARLNATRWDSANLHWNQSQAHLSVYPLLFYTPTYQYQQFMDYNTYNFSSTAPTIQDSIVNSHYMNLSQGGRGFFDANNRFSFDHVLNQQYMTPPVYAPGYGFVNGGYSPSYPAISNGTNTTTPETAEEKVAKSRYDKLSAMVTALANSGKFSESDKATLEVALKGNSEHKTYVEKYNYLKGEYDKIVKDDTTRAKVRKILINAGLGSGNSVIVTAGSNESVNKQLLEIGYARREDNPHSEVLTSKDALSQMGEDNPNSTNIAVNVDSNNVLDFISSWNSESSIDKSFVLEYKKVVEEIDEDQISTATEALVTVSRALKAKAMQYVTEDSPLDETTKTRIKTLANNLEKELKSGNLKSKDFEKLNTTFNELYVKTRLAAATVLGNDLAKTYGGIDPAIFNVDMFINETKKDLSDELNKGLVSTVNNANVKLSQAESNAREEEAKNANEIKQPKEKSSKKEEPENEAIVKSNFDSSVKILISNGDIKKSKNTVKIDGKDENIYSQTVNGKTKYYIISGTNFKEVENVTMDSTGNASIEKDGENEKTPNVKDEEISAETLEKNMQPEKDAKEAVNKMTDTNAKMKVGDVKYPVYSFSSGDTTKYYINMGTNFNEVTDVTESEDGKISVENAKIETCTTSATAVKTQVEEARPKAPVLNDTEIANLTLSAKKLIDSVSGQWKSFSDQKEALKEINHSNVIKFYQIFADAYNEDVLFEKVLIEGFDLTPLFKSLVERALGAGLEVNDTDIKTLIDAYGMEIESNSVKSLTNMNFSFEANYAIHKISYEREGKKLPVKTNRDEIVNAFKNLISKVNSAESK